jgi:general secretion pathway protein I
MNKCRDQSAGFTLIEVLVSLAILSISMAVLLNIFSDSLDRTRRAESEMAAGSLVQSLLAEAGVSKSLRIGDETGEYNNGFRWRLHVEPFGSEEDARAWSVSAVRVTASVMWDDGGPAQSKSLTTLRLVPPEPSR